MPSHAVDHPLSSAARATLARHAVRDLGGGGQPMLMVHGYGCNQAMWEKLIPYVQGRYRVILMDHVGTSASQLTDWDPVAYAKLDRFADDVAAVVEALDLRNVVLVGHSVSAIISATVARAMPARIHSLIMIGPSACYLNEGGYHGGFEREDIAELLASVESNYIGWSEAMAPNVMGATGDAGDSAFLTERFCEQDPEVAYVFAKATFETDSRAEMAYVTVPTLVLQCSQDIIAPEAAGRFVADQVPDAQFYQLQARGHCPNFSAPQETAEAMLAYLTRLSAEGSAN